MKLEDFHDTHASIDSYFVPFRQLILVPTKFNKRLLSKNNIINALHDKIVHHCETSRLKVIQLIKGKNSTLIINKQ